MKTVSLLLALFASRLFASNAWSYESFESFDSMMVVDGDEEEQMDVDSSFYELESTCSQLTLGSPKQQGVRRERFDTEVPFSTESPKKKSRRTFEMAGGEEKESTAASLSAFLLNYRRPSSVLVGGDYNDDAPGITRSRSFSFWVSSEREPSSSSGLWDEASFPFDRRGTGHNRRRASRIPSVHTIPEEPGREAREED